MIRVIKTFVIIGLFGMMISCSDTEISTNEPSTVNENETTENLTTDLEITTEIPNTDVIIQTTIQIVTDIPTNQTTTETTTSDSTTEVPTTSESTTQVPTTQVPTTQVPTTQAPTTQAPTTQAPTTQAPTTTESTTEVTTSIDYVTISFITNGGNTIDSITGEYNDPIPKPSDPIRDGYIFDGWYSDESLTNAYYISQFPDEDITVYAKWTEEVTIIDELTQILENDFNFTCSNNVCTLEESSELNYTFNLNTVTFTKELLDDDTTGDEQTKTETVVIDENWNVEYNISITYLSSNTASMRVTGNGTTGSYTVRSFSSNYLSEDNMYDDAVQFIDKPYGAVGLLEIILNNAGITMDDLKN